MRRGGSRSHKCAGMGPVSDARCEEFRYDMDSWVTSSKSGPGMNHGLTIWAINSAVSEILVKVARGQLGLLGLNFVSGRS